MIYIGTPHSFYTIYQVETDDSKPDVEPFLLGFNLLKLPILDEEQKSSWPQRFSEEKIASIRARSGENKFLSQMMLEPVNIIDSVLDPSRLSAYKQELSLLYSNGREILKIGEKKMISASCWWDPSFGVSNKGDNSVIACVFTDEEGRYWLHDIEYIRVEVDGADNIASLQCEKVAEFLIKNHLPSVRVEANGIGKFLPSILKQTLRKKNLRVAVLEVFSHENKQQRIVNAFEVLLAERALNVHQKIWQTGFIEEMREWSFSSSKKDDALDAVAGCLSSEPVRFPMGEVGKLMPSWQGVGEQYKALSKFEI